MTSQAPFSSCVEEQRVDDPTDAGQSMGTMSGLSALAADGADAATSPANARLAAVRPAVRTITRIPQNVLETVTYQ